MAAVLADPTLTVEQREEIERELEKDLVLDYVTWLGRTNVRKHLFSNGREADLYDKQRLLIIEAKANHRDDVMVATAWAKRAAGESRVTTGCGAAAASTGA